MHTTSGQKLFFQYRLHLNNNKRQNDIAVCEPCARKGIKSLDSQEYHCPSCGQKDILVNLGILSLSSHMVRKPRYHFDACTSMCDNDFFQLSFSHMIEDVLRQSCVRMKVEKDHYHTSSNNVLASLKLFSFFMMLGKQHWRNDYVNCTK